MVGVAGERAEVAVIRDTSWPIAFAYLDYLAHDRNAKQSTVVRAWSVLCKWIIPQLQSEKPQWAERFKGAKRALASRGKRGSWRSS